LRGIASQILLAYTSLCIQSKMASLIQGFWGGYISYKQPDDAGATGVWITLYKAKIGVI
jgi:hypothetical protein